MSLRSAAIRIAAKLPKGDPTRRGILEAIASYDGNADGNAIYDHEIDHGYEQPLAGGTDVMKRLQNQFRKEQGLPEREPSPVIPKTAGR
jgi:hypothetical protein